MAQSNRRHFLGTASAMIGRFGLEPPARTTIAAAGAIPGNSLAEIDCVATA